MAISHPQRLFRAAPKCRVSSYVGAMSRAYPPGARHAHESVTNCAEFCNGARLFAASAGFVSGHVRVPVTTDAVLRESPEKDTEEGVAVRRLCEGAAVRCE